MTPLFRATALYGRITRRLGTPPEVMRRDGAVVVRAIQGGREVAISRLWPERLLWEAGPAAMYALTHASAVMALADALAEFDADPRIRAL